MLARSALVLLFAGLAVVSPVAAADDPFAQADKHAAEFSARIAKDDVGSAIEYVKALASKGFGETLDKLAKTSDTQRRDIVIPRQGKPVGEVELVERYTIGTSFAKYVYVERFEKSGLIWTIALYRRPEGWFFHDVTYSDKIGEFYQKRK